MVGPLKGYCTFDRGAASSGAEFMIFFCVMMRKSLFDEIGLLDEDFTPGSGEDCALSWKAVAAGYKLLQVPIEGNLLSNSTVAISYFPIVHVAGSTGGGDYRVLQKNNLKLIQKFKTQNLKLHFTDSDPQFGYYAVSDINKNATLNLAVNNFLLENASVDAVIVEKQYGYQQYETLLSECARVLKINGYLQVSVDAVHGSFIEKLLKNNNLEVDKLDTANDKLIYNSKKVNERSLVYDCFMFFNEFDVLEIRLNELDDVVDYFVLVESTKTHQGNPKPLYFEENKNRFAKFLHKVIHVVVDDMPQTQDPWVRENYQRNCIYRGIQNCKPNDIIILADVDEIPRADVIRNYNINMGLTCIETKMFYYKLNYLLEGIWYKLRIFPFSAITNSDIQQFRGKHDYDYKSIIPNGGWHFSFLGDNNHIKQKLESYGHIEYNNDYVKNDANINNAINNAVDVLGRNIKMSVVPIDEKYPSYVRNNMAYYANKNLIAKIREKDWMQVRDMLKSSDESVYKKIYDVDAYRIRQEDVQNKVVIDIGAYCGHFTFRCMELGAYKSYCYEPNPVAFAKIKTLTTNDQEIKIHNVGIFDGSIKHAKISNNASQSNIYGDSTQFDINMLSLTEVLSSIDESDKNLKRVLKIDCEGAEFEIIMNNPADIIKSFTHIFIEIHDHMNPTYLNQSQKLINYIKDLGFETADTGPQSGYWLVDGSFIPSPIYSIKFVNINSKNNSSDEVSKNMNITNIQQKNSYINNFIETDMKDSIVAAFAVNKDRRYNYFRLDALTKIDLSDSSISDIFCKDILNEYNCGFEIYNKIFAELGRILKAEGRICIRTNDGAKDVYITLLTTNNFSNIHASYYQGKTFIIAEKNKTKVLEPVKNNIEVSIVIPTYNHLDDCLKPCLRSIIEQTDLEKVEVIVVANGCTDDTREFVESLGEPFKLIWLDEAAGYPRATNAGIMAAKGEYVVLLNNDTAILEFKEKNYWINALKEPFTLFDKVGITGPLKGYCPFVDASDTVGEPFMIFFCVMMRRSLFDEIGLLDEDFTPGGGEDTAFSWKALHAGYQLLQIPLEGNLHTHTKYGVGQFPIFHNPGSTRGDDYNTARINNIKLMHKFKTKNLKLHFTFAKPEQGYFMVSDTNYFATLNLDPTQIDFANESVAAIIIQEQYTMANVDKFMQECWRILQTNGSLKLIVKDFEQQYVQSVLINNNFRINDISKDNHKVIFECNKIANRKPKIYDCFCFFNELDILEIRLNELYDYVDHFVLVEMPITHQDKKKPLYFAESKDRFSKFLDKIIHIVVDDWPNHPDPWVREHHQRNCIGKALQNCHDDDIIIVSDVDEIPRGDKIKFFDRKNPWMYFEQNQYHFYLNAESKKPDPMPGVFSRITTYGTMKNMQLLATDIRYRPIDQNHKIANGGWHFTWLGGSKRIVEKLEAFAHQEINIDKYKDIHTIQKNIDSGKDAFGRSEENITKFVEIDKSYPAYIINNLEAYISKGFVKENSAAPKVAIVMPYYNDSLFLNQTIDSILSQAYTNWDLYIIDDGSDMEHAARNIIKSNDTRIRLYEKPNGGPSSARNFALEIIKKNNYKFVAYCDADDRWKTNYLKSQIENLQSCDISYCSADTVFDDGSIAVPFGIPDPDAYPGLEYMLQSPFIYISGVVHDARCMTVGYFDGDLNSIEDWDMWARMAEAGFRFAKNKNTKIIYTVKKESNMSSKRSDTVYDKFKLKHGFLKNV
jgi:beta-1,4-mannosyl-glycoprotein beta-1,4-N-acetylglucosaminyltransferase